jgi:hypothetical protein
MSQGAAALRRRLSTETWLAMCGRVESEENERREQVEQLREDNASLREQLAEVEGWYRLLQADHASLQDNERQISRRTTELQAERNGLESENQELRALVARLGEAGRNTQEHREDFMYRFASVIRWAQRYKWAAAAFVTIATLVARDAAFQGMLDGAFAKARQVAGSRGDARLDTADSGFLRYAAMINSRSQLERARKEYNDGEGTLKGDALLEAQDRLRAAKARDLQARLAFLPELAKRCEEAKVALPRDAAEALAALKAETNE